MPRQRRAECLVSGLGSLRHRRWRHDAPHRLTDPDRETSWGWPDTGSGGGAGGGYRRSFRCPTGSQELARWTPPTARSRPVADHQVLPGAARCRTGRKSGHGIHRVLHCATPGCQSGGWTLLGGTSAATPLLAAMTADADGYSLAHGGGRLGFASPFLYSQEGTGLFRDVTAGSNNISAGGGVSRGCGLRHGNRPRRARRRTTRHRLASATASPSTFDATSLTATESAGTVSSTAPVTIKGTLRTRPPRSRWHPGR